MKSIIVKSKNLFVEGQWIKGWLKIHEDRIVQVEEGELSEEVSVGSLVLDAGEGSVIPGIVDTHCFFMGQYFLQTGENLSGWSAESILTHLQSMKPKTYYMGRHVDPAVWESLHHGEIPEDFPVVLFDDSGEQVLTNHSAQARYGLQPGTCTLEDCWKLMEDVMTDRRAFSKAFRDHAQKLQRQGVTAIKEVVFDDSYGYLPALSEDFRKNGAPLRVKVVSQPVGKPFSVNQGEELRWSYDQPNLSFVGFNMMVDGSMSQEEAHLADNYLGKSYSVRTWPDYQKIQKRVKAADERGLRFSLHAQGDRAVKETLDIFETLEKDPSGKLKVRHSMTDLEFGQAEDFQRMARLGVAAEIYPQIQSIYEDMNAKIALIRGAVGDDISKIWNRKALVEAGVVVSCATDLPLLFPNLPESLYHACGGWFSQGQGPFQPENGITRTDVITAWTTGGAKVLFEEEERRGRLKEGYSADVAIFDRDLSVEPWDQIREAQIQWTIFNGQIVYAKA